MADGARGSRWEHTCSAPLPSQEQLPHLARAEVTMAGQQTPPERLCNDRNNSSYSLAHEKKLRMDIAGKHPVSLQACPKQNENKHLLTVQNGMLSCRHRQHHCWLPVWGSSAGPFVSSEVVPTGKPGPCPAAPGGAVLPDENHTHSVLGSWATASCP